MGYLVFKQSKKITCSVSTHLLLAFALLFNTSICRAEFSIGIVKTYEPSATVSREGKETELSQGAEIFEGDTIVTDANGAVGIMFTDGAVLTLGPSGSMTIDKFLFKPEEKDGALVSTIMKGTVAFFSGAINRIKPGAVKFKTPTATLGLRGTRVIIEVE